MAKSTRIENLVATVKGSKRRFQVGARYRNEENGYESFMFFKHVKVTIELDGETFDAEDLYLNPWPHDEAKNAESKAKWQARNGNGGGKVTPLRKPAPAAADDDWDQE